MNPTTTTNQPLQPLSVPPPRVQRVQLDHTPGVQSPPSRKVRLARKRLEAIAATELENVRLVVVSNRQPYRHTDANSPGRWITPASGLTTALDPVMRICGGTWVAHGDAPGDRVAAPSNCVRVPPDVPSYTLRRVWLTDTEVLGYYNGFANRTLWPLCHTVNVRPDFDQDDWERYREVNERFAEAVLEQIVDTRAIVLVQDYHLALVPQFIKNERPDVAVAQFWHIPWPSAETLRICPWQEELLHGLLGNDLLGFHVPRYCTNFIEGVATSIQARVDRDMSAIFTGERRTFVRSYPISIDPDEFDIKGDQCIPEVARLQEQNVTLLLGVDRMDYIKGIPEKLLAFARLLEAYPQHRGRVSLVQLASPTRTNVPEYKALAKEVEEVVLRINEQYGRPGWQPVLLLRRNLETHQVAALYKLAAVCVVGSLHDGMNLVAKEFVAARSDLRGVLVLSLFAGATVQLEDAVHIHPYNVRAYADALHVALSMPPRQQRERMRRLREQVKSNTVYDWAANLLRDAISVERTLT